MPNTARGEVTVTIAGRPYDLAMTLDFLARAAEAMGVETMTDFERRIPEFRPADMPRVLVALLAGNGVADPEGVAKGATVVEYIACMRALWGIRPAAREEEATADPPKAAT